MSLLFCYFSEIECYDEGFDDPERVFYEGICRYYSDGEISNSMLLLFGN